MTNNTPQIAKFKELARQNESDESTEAFERTLEKLVKPDRADTEKQDKKKPAD